MENGTIQRRFTENSTVTEEELEFEEDLGVTEREIDYRFQEAVRLAKEKSRIMGKPTCEYDEEKQIAYLLYPDGHREYSVSSVKVP